MATKKTAAKKPAAKKASKRKPNDAFMKPVQPSAQLAEIVGSKPLPRTEVTSKVWDYIRKHGLQDSKQKKIINADEKLRPIFGKPSLDMFKMTSVISKHLSPT